MIRIFLLITLSVTAVIAQKRPVVTTASGQISGVREFSGLFHTYYSFKGIPYAAAPVGDLRFRNPVPPKSWSGIRDASSHGNHCPNDGISGIGAGGHEDCLFLNVYTPNLNGNLSVMFWIHGGAFIIGDGNTLVYGPDLLVRESVIIVTINYRLSSLGFLSTGDKNAQGNYGLKDMVMALRWVRNNIAAFGGNAEKVTVFGQSAGSVAIHYLILSNMSKGLFQQAIMQSGTALSPFALQKNAKSNAEYIGRKLGLAFNSTEVLMNQLRKVDFRKILAAERSLFQMETPLGLRSFDFVPTVEPADSLEEILLSDDPINIMMNRSYQSIPIIIGTTDNEGLLMVREYLLDRSVFQRYNKNPDFFVPTSFQLQKNSSDTNEVADAFKNLYFNGKQLSEDNLDGWAKFHTDAQFKFPTDRTIKYFSQNTAEIYYYDFTFVGALNFLKTLLFLRGYDGACHADDIFYLFSPKIPIPVWPTDHALTVRRRYIRLFTNFAKYGNPTPNTDNLINKLWPKYSVANEFMDIGHDLRIRAAAAQDRLNPWHEFQKRFTGHI